MNRELKFALIVGFALVLVVTVLISDHLSRARGSKLASDVSTRPALVTAPVEAREPALVTGPERVAQQDPQPSSLAMNSPESGAGNQVPGEVTPPMGTPGEAPVEPVLIAQGNPATGTSGAIPGDDIRSVIERIGGTIRDGTIYLNPAAAKDETTLPPSAPVRTTMLGESSKPLVEPIIEPKRPEVELKPPAPAPTEQWYTIAAGDSAFKIAKRYYGNGNQWRRLVEANPGRVGADGTVRAGIKILIPGAPVALGSGDKGKAEIAKVETPKVKPAPKETAPVTDGKTRSYVIKKGDTLGLIAQRELGTTRRASEIIALNKSVLTNPDVVPVGVSIKLPAK